MSKSKGILRIGTSGIVVPGSKETFPEEFKDKSRLSYYASLFNTLEVNSTFKKLPMESTVEKWALDVPDNFQFTIKLWKEITHKKQLDIDIDNVDTFFNTINHMGSKKGCLLVQFPASITHQYSSKVEEILARFKKLDQKDEWKIAVEFRSETWYNGETRHMLDRYSTSMVLQDMPKSNNLDFHQQNATFFYFRYHGPTGNYRGSYSNEFLKEQAEKITKFINNNKDVYAYFNNTMGDAYKNAMTLKTIIESMF